MVRIVGSLTTLPKRLPHISNTLFSLFTQSYPLDMIYLHVPYKTTKGKSYVIPQKIIDYTKIYNNFTINRCKDYGPLTKLLPTLKKEPDPETLIITFDDDVFVGVNVVKILMNKIEKHPDCALSFSGYCVGTFPFLAQLVVNNKEDVKVDWIQGVHSIMYKRKWLKFKEILALKIDGIDMWKQDDHIMGVYLEMKSIGRLVINSCAYEHFICQSYNNIDAISKEPFFCLRVLIIILKLKLKAIYYHSYSIFLSPIFVIFCFVWLIGGLIIFKFQNKMWLIILFILGIYSWFNNIDLISNF